MREREDDAVERVLAEDLRALREQSRLGLGSLDETLRAAAARRAPEGRRPRSSRSALVGGILVAAAAAAVALIAGLGDRPAPPGTDAPAPVRMAGAAAPRLVPASSSGAPVLRAAGYTAARSPSSLGMPVGGSIAAVNVESGARVKRGQIVASLDVSAALAERSAASANIRVAEDALKSKRQLYKAQVVTLLDLQAQEGAVALERAKLYPINQRIEQAKVRSPIDGTVLAILAHPGDTLMAAATIMKVADLSRMTAELEINEGDIVKVFQDQEVEAIADSFPGRLYQGRVVEIASQADKTKGTMLVKVDLDVPDQSLRPNMSIKGSFLPKRARGTAPATR
jgi:RND family efflux transporter MFP subunit